MSQAAQTELLPASEVARATPVHQPANRLNYAMFADTHVSPQELEEIVQAVPSSVAAALAKHAYYFVPLAIGETEETMVAPNYTVELGDRAVCHRNVRLDGADYTFISTRLMQGRFALAFEFFINAARHFVDVAGVPESFSDLVWSQAVSGVRGETSQDAYEERQKAFDHKHGGASSAGSGDRVFARTGRKSRAIAEKLHPSEGSVDEKAKTSYFESSFSDALAIYMLSLALDFEYADLREREYPLLSPPALAERLRHIASLFSPNPGYLFEISYRSKDS